MQRIFKTNLILALAIISITSTLSAAEIIPSKLNYQGYIESGGTPFEGTGSLKFAIVNKTGDTTYWSNDGTSTAGSEPANAVSATVTNGVFNIILGDTALTNMTAVPKGIFGKGEELYLRIWFDDGTVGFEQLTPDKEITSSAYAFTAEIPDNTITTLKIQDSAVTAKKIAIDAVTGGNILDKTITAADIADGVLGVKPGAITETELADSAVTNLKIAADAVTSTKIQDKTITALDIADGVLGVKAGAITETELADNAVTANKIKDESVTEPKLDVLDTPAGGEVLGWNSTQTRMEWIPQPVPEPTYWIDKGAYLNPKNTDQISITDTGHLGIGTTAPQAKLHILDSVRLAHPSNQGKYIDLFTRGSMLDLQAEGAGLCINYSSKQPVQIGSSGYNTNLNIYGKVGIGTSNPQQPLDVYGPIRASYDSANCVEIGHDGTHTYINRKGKGNIDLRSEGKNLITITPTGKIGIGTTAPLGLLTMQMIDSTNKYYPIGITQYQVGGTATMELTTTDTKGAQATRVLLRGAADNTNIEFYRGARGAEQQSMIINGLNGNVGIGTNMPLVRLSLGTHPMGRKLAIWDELNKFYGFGCEPGRLTFYTNNAEQMTINHDGTVGIGTTAPTAKLDIDNRNGYSQIRLRKDFTPNSSTDSRGNTGEICWDNNYIYVKTPLGWKRAQLSSW